MHPRREQGVAAEPGELAEGRDEGVLGGVGRVVGVAEDAQAHVVDALLVALDEGREGSRIARQVPADELVVALGVTHAGTLQRRTDARISFDLDHREVPREPEPPGDDGVRLGLQHDRHLPVASAHLAERSWRS